MVAKGPAAGIIALIIVTLMATVLPTEKTGEQGGARECLLHPQKTPRTVIVENPF
jgi:hypothetical protein